MTWRSENQTFTPSNFHSCGIKADYILYVAVLLGPFQSGQKVSPKNILMTQNRATKHTLNRP